MPAAVIDGRTQRVARLRAELEVDAPDLLETDEDPLARFQLDDTVIPLETALLGAVPPISVLLEVSYPALVETSATLPSLLVFAIESADSWPIGLLPVQIIFLQRTTVTPAFYVN